MVGHDDVCTITDEKLWFFSSGGEFVYFFEQYFWVNDNSVTDDCCFSLDGSAGHEVEFVDVSVDVDGMSGVVSSLESDDIVSVFCVVINDFSFPFIAPLGSDNQCDRHNFSFFFWLYSPSIFTSIFGGFSRCCLTLQYPIAFLSIFACFFGKSFGVVTCMVILLT